MARWEVASLFVGPVVTFLPVVALLVLADTLGPVGATELTQVAHPPGTASLVTLVLAVVVPEKQHVNSTHLLRGKNNH